MKPKSKLPLNAKKITIEITESLYDDIESVTLEGLHGTTVEQTAAILLSECFQHRYLRPSQEEYA